jgi:long-chain acyl-CoA synthetase
MLEKEVSDLINTKNGFKAFERINKISIITKPFEIGIELSAKQEMMRFRIADIYKDKIAELYREE